MLKSAINNSNLNDDAMSIGLGEQIVSVGNKKKMRKDGKKKRKSGDKNKASMHNTKL